MKLAQSVRPGQVIIYNGWEPYQFRNGQGTNTLEAGMVKWLRLAGGYGHLQYWPFEWSPVPTMRASRVEVTKIDGRPRPSPRPRGRRTGSKKSLAKTRT